ncbi:hypothetical protein [Nocardioides plantarum]|uniref:Uncharacterized protein n=1 Tax=Nocardioides plantarum TaxID=29299 RepID=A0ABV5K480_9ACTN|nr:hypothetical protein [Nocardioides plantarum]
MGFSLNLSQFLDVVPTTSSAPQGLDLAVEAIDDVIKRIEAEMDLLQPNEFASAGTIQSVSFGGADAAPNLALHYTRAHEVTWKTLRGVKSDLVAFQEACRTAKQQIVLADEDSADQYNRTRTAIEALEAGSDQHQGRWDHQQAQQDQDTTGGEDL